MFKIPSGCCSRQHTSPPIVFDLDFGALTRIAATLRRCHPDFARGCVLLVADGNTWAAAGSRAEQALVQNGFTVKRHVFSQLDCASMEDAQLLARLAADVQGILAVGTGTINDLCRYASFLTGKPYAVAATAPSMDGFCSGVAPLVEHGFKRTYNAVLPRAVIGDAEVLDASPMPLKAAGLGDLLGKYTCLADWEISHLLTGEYYCPGIAGMVRQAVDDAVAGAPQIASGAPGAALLLMKALCLSGVAMALCGNSRPASGAEHHLSHFWEMRFLAQGRKQVFHGTKVGVASVAVSGLYRRLAALGSVVPYRKAPPVLNEEFLAPAFGPLTADVIKDNTPDPLAGFSFDALAQRWPQVQAILSHLPAPERIASLITLLGGPTSPDQLGIDPSLALEGLQFGRYVRPRLTLLRITDCLDLPAAGIPLLP